MDSKIATSRPNRSIQTVDRIELFSSLQHPFKRGPFITKSKGSLIVNFAPRRGEAILRRFLDYDPEEVARIPLPMITIREYEVLNLPRGNSKENTILGGTEFHRIREEVVICTGGKVQWTCEDVYGGKIETVLCAGDAVWMPPFILHTYMSLKDGSSLRVLCNTFFYPNNPETSDTYSEEMFRELQAKYAN